MKLPVKYTQVKRQHYKYKQNKTDPEKDIAFHQENISANLGKKSVIAPLLPDGCQRYI
jgi:hypothetical protein